MARKPIVDPVLAGITGNPTLTVLDPMRYRARPLGKLITFTSGDGGTQTADVQKVILAAWAYVRDKCAAHQACNTYFKKLPGGVTLREVMETGGIVICQLDPPTPNPIRPRVSKPLPYAVTNGRQISLSEETIAEGHLDLSRLSAVLVHELAHVAGATGDPGDTVHGADAETALKHCLLSPMFDPNVLGTLQGRSLSARGRV